MMREAVKLKKEAFQARLAMMSPEATDRYCGGQEGCCLGGHQSKNPGVVRVQGDYG